MQIICSKTFRVVNDNGETILVSPSPHPQQVPDWIRDTLLFQLAKKDHSIQEIVFVPESAAEDVSAEAEEKQQSTKKSRKAGSA